MRFKRPHDAAKAPEAEHGGTVQGKPKPTAPLADTKVRELGVRLPDDNITNDLIRRVLSAIDEWAKVNKLNALPKHIIFEQALSILNAIDRHRPPEQ